MNASSAHDSFPSEDFGVEAFGTVRVPLTEVDHLRKNPGRDGLHPVLRHADEQSVLAVVAVLRAIESRCWANRSFEDWAVLAAPRYLGRARLVACWEKYQRSGVRGVTPWAIPNLSLHAVSGTVSMVLGSHGPNFGVGGSEGHLSEAFEALLPLLRLHGTTGIWLVLSEWSAEACPDRSGKVEDEPIGHAVALALGPNKVGCPFRLIRRPNCPTPLDHSTTLEGLTRFLADETREVAWSVPMSEGCFELRRRAA